jgi:hypothetical protein
VAASARGISSILGICIALSTLSARAQPLAEPSFDGEQAYQHLKEICAIGGRVSGSPGMERQQAYLTKHFRFTKSAA